MNICVRVMLYVTVRACPCLVVRVYFFCSFVVVLIVNINDSVVVGDIVVSIVIDVAATTYAT